MPSPTDSTWPTSETSASWPKFLICSLRIAEISAARISISANLYHRSADRIELGLERGVDETRADLDLETTEQGRIDGDGELHMLAGHLVERVLEGGGVSV